MNGHMGVKFDPGGANERAHGGEIASPAGHMKGHMRGKYGSRKPAAGLFFFMRLYVVLRSADVKLHGLPPSW